MKKIRFLFYSWDGVFKNDHIFKEHGAIIDYFNRHGYDAKMVCVDHGQKVDTHEKLDKKISIKRIKNRHSLWGISLWLLQYLFSKKIDLLILTHFSPKTFIYALWYRLFHAKWAIYVKGDFDAKRFKKNGNGFINTNNSLVRTIERGFVHFFFAMINRVTVETNEGFDALLRYDTRYTSKVAYMPNGYDEEFLKENDLEPAYREKKNTIISIGRIGTHQKNSERMMDILAQLELNDWKFYAIGTIEPSFQRYLDRFFEKHPELREKIIFTWPIYDRKEIFRRLREAKLYLCSSRFEGFSLVFTELLSQGCYLVTTPVSGAEDSTDNGRLGSILEKDDEFIHTLQQFIDTDSYDAQLYTEIIAHAKDQFTWEKNLEKLEDLLFGKH